ncbi:PAS domain-containing protein [Pelatocladus sp. BLCC-F211]|uniref:PAS domain-containing protein n=1 Tax=Pelatocladus sp. BLCC-F211 TaxID=3342752 RepID=UPI0035B92AA2
MTNLILVVDDDDLVRRQLRELLVTAGYGVVEASSGEEALAIYTQQQPKLVLLDALMSGMDGFSCCAQLKALPGGDRTPVLMVTGLVDQESIEKAFAAGAADFITKPIKWPILRQRVQRLLEASSAMHSLQQQTKQQILVAELSQQALVGIDLILLMQQAVTFIAECLEVEYCKVLELLPDGNKLLLRAGVGWQPGLVGEAIVSAGINSQAGYTLVSNDPVVVEDLRTETRFTGPQLLIDHQVISGLSVIIHGKERPFGVLGAHATQYRTFSKDDIYFLQATANVLATAIARQQVEDALKESEQRWHLVLRGNNDGIWDWNVKTNEVFYSTRWKEMLGYEEQEISNHLDEWSNRVHPDDIDWVRQVIQDHFEQKTPFYMSEYRLRCKDGTYKWILDRGQALWNDQGDVVRMAGSHSDITERKLAEENLHQSEERFQFLARATTDVVWDWDVLKDYVWWNNNVQILFGYLPEQIGNNANWWYECIHPDDRQRIFTDIHTAIESKQLAWTNEYRFCRSDGSYAYIFDRGYIVRDRTGNPIRMIGAMMDISDRKLAQEELQRQNMRSRLFADITLKIRQSLQIDEILQTTVTEIQKLLNADRVVIFKLLSESYGSVVKEALIPGFPVIIGENIIDPCFNETYIDKYKSGRVGMISNVEESNVESCYLEMLQRYAIKANLVVPILQHNKLWGLLIAHQCAHPRDWNAWEIELLRQLADQMGIALGQAKLLEQETRQREELSRSNNELQEFAFVASHDLQEPLRKIKTFGDRLKASCGDVLPEQGHDYLERIQNAARRMQILIEDLLSLSRVTTRAQPFIPVDLLQVTQEVLSDLEISIQQTGAKIEIGELSTINADPLQIRQLLQNLIGNALKFHRPKVRPIVKIYSQALLEPSEHSSAEKCQIIVEDNGIGFNEKYLDRIFNVFQRLHGRSEYEGTGIGLAICRKIVERHHGSITARSEPGQGAKFIVTLPIHPHS